MKRNVLVDSITWEANWELLDFTLRLHSLYSLMCLSILTVTKIGDCDLWRRARLQIQKNIRQKTGCEQGGQGPWVQARLSEYALCAMDFRRTLLAANRCNQAQMDVAKRKGWHALHPRSRQWAQMAVTARDHVLILRRLHYGEITGPVKKCQLHLPKEPIRPAQLRAIFQYSPANLVVLPLQRALFEQASHPSLWRERGHGVSNVMAVKREPTGSLMFGGDFSWLNSRGLSKLL